VLVLVVVLVLDQRACLAKKGSDSSVIILFHRPDGETFAFSRTSRSRSTSTSSLTSDFGFNVTPEGELVIPCGCPNVAEPNVS
jgi:hypothetical protein